MEIPPDTLETVRVNDLFVTVTVDTSFTTEQAVVGHIDEIHILTVVRAAPIVGYLSRLCARSWLARHPAKIEITGSSGGSSHHTKIFFFCKNHDFSRFLINFSTVVVVKHTHVVDPKRLTHIHSHRDLNSLSLSTESTYLLVPMP